MPYTTGVLVRLQSCARGGIAHTAGEAFGHRSNVPGSEHEGVRSLSSAARSGSNSTPTWHPAAMPGASQAPLAQW